MKYQVLSIDAWAGDEAGEWDCNDWFKSGVIEIAEGVEGNAIIELMIEEGFLKPKALGLVVSEDISDSTIRLSCESSFQPLFDLVMIEGGE